MKPCPRCKSENVSYRGCYDKDGEPLEVSVIECECGIQLVTELDEEETIAYWDERTSKAEVAQNSTSNNTLKAEISQVVIDLKEHCKNRSYVLLDTFIERLEKLSAVD